MENRVTMPPDCGADLGRYASAGTAPAFNLTRWAIRPLSGAFSLAPAPCIIARRASARPISTKAEVTSGPPTRMRVGVFILFHS